MSKKILISTLGCKVNHADSDELSARYLSEGHSLVGNGEPADICIVNTCTVTAKADSECRNEIRRLRRMYPNAKIVVTGCYVNVAGEELKNMPEVDEVSLTSDLRLPIFRTEAQKRSRPQIKIQDGCDNFCTYCIVPYARGRSRSVPLNDVLSRIGAFREHGVPEVVFTGIHLGGYGTDLKPRVDLLSLLKEIEGQGSGGKGQRPRVRLSSIEPDEFTPELIEFISSNDLICPHFHIPLQSGDDEMLRAMGRKYSVADYKRLIDALTTSNKQPATSDIAIGTDIIVGFPGETKESFERTFKFIESLPLAYLHIFPYSKRKLTAASKLKETVTAAEKKERAVALRELSEKKRETFYALQTGKKLNVVIERRRDKETGLLRGISGNYVPVNFEGPDALMGKMVTVGVTRFHQGRVHGELYEA